MEAIKNFNGFIITIVYCKLKMMILLKRADIAKRTALIYCFKEFKENF